MSVSAVQQLMEEFTPGPGATPADLEELSAYIKAPLPDEYRAFLEVANGWEDALEHFHILSVQEITSGAFDEIDDVRDDVLESGYDGCWMVAHILEEDTGLFLLTKGEEVTFVEAHQSLPGDPESFGAHLERMVEEGKELMED